MHDERMDDFLYIRRRECDGDEVCGLRRSHWRRCTWQKKKGLSELTVDWWIVNGSVDFLIICGI